MKIIVRNQDDLTRFITLIQDKIIVYGKKYRAIFEEIRKEKTHGQLSVLHIWFRCLADELEGDKAQAAWYKEYYKQKFLPGIAPPEVKIIRGVRLEKYSIADLNTLQASQLMTAMQRDARDQFNILLLTLEDKNFMEFYETYK